MKNPGLEDQARELMANEHVRADAVTMERGAAMRYIGQSYEVFTPLPDGELGLKDIDVITKAFWQQHQLEYGVHSEEFPCAMVNLRLTVFGVTEKPSQSNIAAAFGGGQGTGAPAGSRRVYFDRKPLNVNIYNSASLPAGIAITGPAVVEQQDGVIVIPTAAEAAVDTYGNLVITLEGQHQ